MATTDLRWHYTVCKYVSSSISDFKYIKLQSSKHIIGFEGYKYKAQAKEEANKLMSILGYSEDNGYHVRYSSSHTNTLTNSK